MKSFTTSFTVDQSPREVYEAINDVRAWWTGKIDGAAKAKGDEFTYQYKKLHRSTQKVTQQVPGKKVVWQVTDAALTFLKKQNEWNGTELVFDIEKSGGKTEVTFTHKGLLPSCECYEACHGGWTFYIQESLKSLITTGKGLEA